MESSSTPRKEKKGLGRLWTKAKLVFRSKSKSNPSSKPTTTNPSDTPIAQPEPSQSYEASSAEVAGNSTDPSRTPHPLDTQTSTQPPAEMEQSSVHAVQTGDVAGVASSNNGPAPPVSSRAVHEPMAETSAPSNDKDEHHRRYERAQAVFKKYNLDLDDVEWDSRPAQGERVYKSPRMRVRWTCHECKTTFGHDKICVECAHQRCRECPRYPPRKKKARIAKRAAATADVSANPQEVHNGTCHECQTSFELGSTECSNCHHEICERCLQETVASAEQAEAQGISAH